MLCLGLLESICCRRRELPRVILEMIEALDKLLDDLMGDDEIARQEAVSTLSDFFNLKNRQMEIVGYENAADYYRTVLPEELASLPLSAQIEQEISQRIADWMCRNPCDSYTMYVWSKMSAAVALESILRFVVEYGDELDERTQSQALSALQNMLIVPLDAVVVARLRSALKTYDPRPFIERSSRSTMPGMRSCAEHCRKLYESWF